MAPKSLPHRASAVAYFRMSTNLQDKSIPQQRAWQQAQAKLENLQVEAEFKDEGISGAATDRRDDFHRMLAFCQQRHREGRPVEVIICYSASRFSRADSHETSAYIWQFRQAGTHRILTASRWFDWRVEQDRVLFNLQQDMTEHRYLLDLSKNIARGKLARAQTGRFAGGGTPYGFDRMILNERGEPVRRVRRTEKFHKPKQWDSVLVPSENVEEVETVRWLYRQYAYTDISLNALTRALSARGIPAPASTPERPRKWQVLTLRHLLENPHNCGDARIGGDTGSGKYHRIRGGEVIQVTADQTKRSAPAVPPVILRDVHDGLIDRETWELVQQRLIRRRVRAGRSRSNGYLLSGLLRCGNCGAVMHGETQRSAYRGKEYSYAYYTCSGSVRVPLSCSRFSIRENKLVRLLVRKLEEDYLAPEKLEGLEAEIRGRLTAKRDRSPGDADRLRERIAALDKDIIHGRQQALRAKDSETFVQYDQQIQEWLEQKGRLERELEAAKKRRATPEEDIVQAVREAVERLKTLRERLAKLTKEKWERVAPALREVFRQMVVGIDVYFQVTKKCRVRQKYRLSRGLIRLRPQLSLTGSVTHLPEQVTEPINIEFNAEDLERV